MILLGLRAILPDVLVINNEKRFIFRLLTLMIQSLIHVITVSFTHSVQNKIKLIKFKLKLSNSTEHANKTELETFDRTKTLHNQTL